MQNVTATVNLKISLDLRTVALKARNAEYKPKRFPGVIIRIREPKATALVFRSGKMVIIGAKSEECVKLAARKFTRIIQKVGFQPKFADFKVRNVVATCVLGFNIRLEGLAMKHRQFAHYEPELFPGLIYRIADSSAVVLAFTTGKIVITGAKTRQAMYKIFDDIYPVLREFEKHEGPED
ncbi:TATA-binding protein (TBP) [Maublancomyces gigas]|uniref:TATA-binding protein (TBP) n=1 Tax=Discina gigas TaxID=1032678 RepID=A0ABR3GCT4_9PEZI